MRERPIGAKVWSTAVCQGQQALRDGAKKEMEGETWTICQDDCSVMCCSVCELHGKHAGMIERRVSNEIGEGSCRRVS